jgi:hypothetical protein
MKIKYVNIMKTKYVVATLFAILISMAGCDKGFEQLNVNPLSPTSLDPAYSLVSAQTMGGDDFHYEGNIVQQTNNILGGQEAAGNRNINVDGFCSQKWNACYPRIRTLVDVLNTLNGTTDRTNLYNMARIMKAWNAMILVDTYGDVPYTEAGLGYLKNTFYPKYDNQQDIYLDIEKELKEATDALDATKDKVTGEMYFKGDIAKWKKFGNSLLLRLGMRYSKSNPTKARSIVQTATDAARGGVIVANADNVIIPYNATQTNPNTGVLTSSVRQNFHAGRPLVDFLFNNKDPRMKYIICKYSDPSSLTGGTRDTVRANQVGAPYGYTESTIVNDPKYPGIVSQNIWKYSFINRQSCGRVDAIVQIVTAAQTQLLMAEAAQRGWLTGTVDVAGATAYYNNAVTQALSQKDIFSETRNAASPITAGQITTYLARPGITYDGSTLNSALKQINEQYWLACFLIWHEGWCNFRRSGYPQLAPINFPGQDASVTAGDGFIHRLNYLINEYSVNKDIVNAAATAIGGDNLGNRVFWDTK